MAETSEDWAISPQHAAQLAYGLLWLDPLPSMPSKAARKQLLHALSHEERKAGIGWAMKIAADIRENIGSASDNALLRKAKEMRHAIDMIEGALMRWPELMELPKKWGDPRHHRELGLRDIKGNCGQLYDVYDAMMEMQSDHQF